MKCRALAFLLLAGAFSCSVSAADLVPLASHSVLATATPPVDLHGVLDGLQTEVLPQFTPADIAAIDQQYEEQMMEKNLRGVLDNNPAEVQRVQAIVRRLARQTSRFRPAAAAWSWEVHVVHNSTPSAFSRPGGKIEISTGMIDGRRLSDDEIAAVVAHEMGHILTNAPMSRIPTIQRNQETEADVIGLELMSEAGFNPNAAVRLLARTSEGQIIENPLADSHPTKMARARLLSKLLPQAMALYRAATLPSALAGQSPTNVAVRARQGWLPQNR
jgi:Zn-dependent protease with chaperone function